MLYIKYARIYFYVMKNLTLSDSTSIQMWINYRKYNLSVIRYLYLYLTFILGDLGREGRKI